MRIDLPQCDFKKCRFQADGNCTKEQEYKRCSYIHAIKTIETIMESQKFCILCANDFCKNSNTRDASCKPIWNKSNI